MQNIVSDFHVGSNGRIIAYQVMDVDDPANKALLADLDAHPEKRDAAGWNEVCTYHGAPKGLTRWHHLQFHGVVSGKPEVLPPDIAPLPNESIEEYNERAAKL